MSKSPPTVLFVSHEATLTGAPIALLNLMRWLKQNTQYQILIICLRGGPLLEEFKTLGPTFLLTDFQSVTLKEQLLLKTRLRKPQSSWDRMMQEVVDTPLSLIYFNTITGGKYYADLKKRGYKIITHVHELKGYISSLPEQQVADVLKHTDHFITVSKAVSRMMSEDYAVEESKMTLVYELINSVEIPKISKSESRKERMPFIDKQAFIVGASGVVSIRKGTDIFINIVNFVQSVAPQLDIHFIWVGANMQHHHFKDFEKDVVMMGLKEKISWIPPVKNPLAYFNCFDVFMLTSREDPFPLVCLENALLGKPILCFENSGGMPEFVEDDAGIVVPYRDEMAMAKAIIELAQNGERVKQLGDRANYKITHDFSASKMAERIARQINRMIKQ